MEAVATGLLAIAGLILVKEAGVPIPLPGDLVVIGAGVAANRGGCARARRRRRLVRAIADPWAPAGLAAAALEPRGPR